MKRILISQRVDTDTRRNERRDALDQRWAVFLWQIGAVGFPIPNNPDALIEILNNFSFDGILLTGGNSPVAYGGDSPERDVVDEMLISHAEMNEIPLFGVCRGMQSILIHYGGSLLTVANHVAVRHTTSGAICRVVNSYHTLAALNCPRDLHVLATAQDNVIEAITHPKLAIAGIMWHPEREDFFTQEDILIFKKVLCEKKVGSL